MGKKVGRRRCGNAIGAQPERLVDNPPIVRGRTLAGTTLANGPEIANGRPAEKWELTATMANQTINVHVWLDAKWHFVVKQESAGITGELANIKEGPQPASLFEIPSDYQKMDMGAMMGRHP